MKQGIENNELFSKKNPFKVPDGYFENFNLILMQNIENQSQNIQKVTFWHSWKHKVAVAASIAIFAVFSFSLYYIIIKNQPVNSNIAVVADTADAELSFVDENQIVDAIIITTPELKVEGEDIIDYLINDNVDINLIAEAY